MLGETSTLHSGANRQLGAPRRPAPIGAHVRGFHQSILSWPYLLLDPPLSSMFGHAGVVDGEHRDPWGVFSPPAPNIISTCPLVTLSCEEICSVCLEAMTGARMLPCGHVFHEVCGGTWLETHNTCPTCRNPAASRVNS